MSAMKPAKTAKVRVEKMWGSTWYDGTVHLSESLGNFDRDPFILITGTKLSAKRIRRLLEVDVEKLAIAIFEMENLGLKWIDNPQVHDRLTLGAHLVMCSLGLTPDRKRKS